MDTIRPTIGIVEGIAPNGMVFVHEVPSRRLGFLTNNTPVEGQLKPGAHLYLDVRDQGNVMVVTAARVLGDSPSSLIVSLLRAGRTATEVCQIVPTISYHRVRKLARAHTIRTGEVLLQPHPGRKGFPPAAYLAPYIAHTAAAADVAFAEVQKAVSRAAGERLQVGKRRKRKQRIAAERLRAEKRRERRRQIAAERKAKMP